MSLFSKLIRLHSDERHPLEDFHTEIVANVLGYDPELTREWLKHLGVTELEKVDSITVKTQESFDAIPDHDQGSRIDMVIRIRSGEDNEVVFVESKVGSSASNGQLSRYRDHLHAMPGVNRRSLIFITRDYEHTEDLSDKEVTFIQRRWSDFYRFFRDLESPSDTIRELLQFMKENNMSQSNRFTAIDLLALTNHSHARSLMEATLAEDIASLFQKETGTLCNPKDRLKQLQQNKYTSERFWCVGSDQICYELGYWFPNEQPSESPIIGMKIYVFLKGANYPAIAQAMRKFSAANKETRKWGYQESDDDEWEEIGCTKKLEEFFATQDHVAEIKTWFTELLGDSAAFKRQNPNLPWSAVQPNEV